MNKFSLILLIFFTISIAGCFDNQENTTPEAKNHFDLSQIKNQYRDIELIVSDVSEQSYQNGSALAITLSTPLNPEKDFQNFFKVSNQQGQIIQGNWIISENGLTAYFPEIAPSTHYIIDVFKGLTSATHKKLNKNHSQEITTRRMQSQVSFASQGYILPKKLAKGLPVISVNINEADVDFHRIKADKISHFINNWHNNSGRSAQGSYYLNQYTSYTELVYSGRFPLNPPKNTRHTTHLDLTAINNLKPAGIYLAVMKAAGSYNDQQQVTFFTVSDIGLHARMYSDQMNIQVSALSTGKAMPAVSLSLMTNNKVIDSEKTDQQGQATFISPSHKANLLIARYKDNIALLKLNTPALDLSEFNITGRDYQAVEIFTYGPRDLYRPGETVKINALLRDADGNAISALPINAIIKRPDGQKIKYFTWYANEAEKTQGIYQTSYKLPSNAQTGRWILELKTSDKNTHQYSFQVEAFLPERMELLLGDQPSKPRWANRTDDINIQVSGQYLYGAPAENNRLSSKVILKPNRHPLAIYKDYFFGLEDEKAPVEFYEQDDIKLNTQGIAVLKVPSRWKDIKNSPFTIKVMSSLFETGGRPVTRSINTTLWPQTSLIGIRPTVNLKDISSNSSISFDLINSNHKGILQENTDVIATLIKERRDYYWAYSDHQGWHYEKTSKNFKTFEKALHLAAQQPSKITVPVDWGSYLLIVKNTKTGQSSSLRFRAGHGWYQQQNTASARPDRVQLKWDKKHYQAGDTAQLHILPPYAGNGFITVENGDKPLWFNRASIPAEGLNIQIPIDKDWNRHDLYVSAIIFRPGDAKEKITPNRAIGIIPLVLDRDNRRLNIQIDAPKGIIRPEKTLTTTLSITGLSANKSTYITLAAVDIGVLNITDFKTPDPHQWFFQPRRYNVEQHDIYNRIIELTEGSLVKARFGGDVDKHAGGARPDSAVKIVSLLSKLVQVNDKGQAKIDLDLPDFNGRLRLMAVAFNQNQFGSAETDITVAAPIIAEASLPRFLASGDRSIITLDVRNQSGKTQNLTLSLNANSPVNLNSTPLSFTLNDQEKKVLHFPISADDAFGQSKINIQLNNTDNSIQISRERFLGVRPAYPAINYVEQKILGSGESITLKPNLENLVLASARGQLSISNQSPIDIKQHLHSLLRYPYGCLEQTISSSEPWLSINQDNTKLLNLNKMRINNKGIDIKHKLNYIENGINRLASMQRNNGSFGLWSNNSQEEHWLTAYAADFLLSAQNKGAFVPKELLNKTLTRLTQYLNNRGNMYGERYSQASGHYSFAYKAYAGYVLSRVNRAPLGSLRTLYDHHKKEVKSPLPLAHIGLALYKQGDKKRGLQAITESLTKPRSRLIYLGDYGSRLRDLSMMTSLFIQNTIHASYSKALVYQLADELNNRTHLSTQERNALFRAGIALSNNSNTNWQGQLTINDITSKLQQTETYIERFVNNEIPKTIKYSAFSQENQLTYLQFSINAYPKTAPKMQMKQIKVERNYYDLAGNSVNPKKHHTGDVLLVHLNVRSDQRIKDTLMVELIPAGFELENQNLSNNLQMTDFKIAGKSIEEMQYHNQVKHTEYLDDRFIAAIDLHANRPEHLFYLIRAVTTGTYTNPPPYVEDMYRPYIRAIGREFENIEIVAKD